jgi:hypothetical protein
MAVEGIITLIVVLSLVWGGFLYFLLKAIKFEKRKRV